MVVPSNSDQTEEYYWVSLLQFRDWRALWKCSIQIWVAAREVYSYTHVCMMHMCMYHFAEERHKTKSTTLKTEKKWKTGSHAVIVLPRQSSPPFYLHKFAILTFSAPGNTANQVGEQNISRPMSNK